MMSTSFSTRNIIVSIVLVMLLSLSTCTTASVFLPYNSPATTTSIQHQHSSSVIGGGSSSSSLSTTERNEIRRYVMKHRKMPPLAGMAMAIPGNTVAEQLAVGSLTTFLGWYNFFVTARILLSWFPQAQQIGALQPLFIIVDPFLGLFRGIIPPIFGLDLSPILAFVALNFMGTGLSAIGYEIPNSLQQHKQQQQQQKKYDQGLMMRMTQSNNQYRRSIGWSSRKFHLGGRSLSKSITTTNAGIINPSMMM